MKKKLLKVLSTLLISCNLFAVPASANTWHKLIGYNGDSVTWQMYDDNGVGINGWYQENGEWYYFDYGTAATGLRTIDGKDYYFDRVTCQMKHDQYVKTYEYSAVLSYAESDGHINHDNFTFDDTVNKSTWY